MGHPDEQLRLLLARQRDSDFDPAGELVRVGHDAHKIRILGKRVATLDAEVSDARRHHRKIAGEEDHVRHVAWRPLLEPDADPARIGLEFSGADIVHLSRDVGTRRNHDHRIGGGDDRPHPRHVTADKRGPRLPVVANGRHPKPDAVRILKASCPVVGMAETVAATMLPDGLLGRLPRQVAYQGVMRDLSIAGQKLNRTEPQILLTPQRKHDVAVDVVPVGAELRRLGLLKNDVGGAEILLKDRGVGERQELRRIGGVAFRLAGRHPLPQHGDLCRGWGFRPREIKVALDLRRWHPPRVDLLESDVDPFDGIVIGQQAEWPDLAGAVTPLAMGIEEGQHVALVGDARLG